MQIDIRQLGQVAAMADQISQLSQTVMKLYQENQELNQELMALRMQVKKAPEQKEPA